LRGAEEVLFFLLLAAAVESLVEAIIFIPVIGFEYWVM